MKVQTLVTIEKGKLKELKERLKAAEAKSAKFQEQAEALAKALERVRYYDCPECLGEVYAALAAYRENR